MIRIVGRKREMIPITGQATVGAVVKELKLQENSYIALKNGLPVTSDEPVSVNDEIVFMEVFSGG
ncbi:MAG: MoaD/ThiS family protein [Thermoplasmataceae archaeon]